MTRKVHTGKGKAYETITGNTVEEERSAMSTPMII